MFNISKFYCLIVVIWAIWLGAFANCASAQLPDGVVAPDFSATDINNNPWHLYSLLEEDKVVFLVFSTTWCSPCWAYHQSQALQQFYADYGPSGTDDAVVFFIESDPLTNAACLEGYTGCNSFTFGNWTKDVYFPIFNNAQIATQYQVSYYPTIFKICPDKKLYEVGQLDRHGLEQSLDECPVAYGIHNGGLFNYHPGSPSPKICAAKAIVPTVSLFNLGADSLFSATLSLRWNDTTTLQQFVWQGMLAKYQDTLVVFDSIAIGSPGELSVHLLDVNSLPDDQPDDNVRSADFELSEVFSAPEIILKILTDEYGDEIYWEILDANAHVVAWGGNPKVGPSGGGEYPTGAPPDPNAYGNKVFIKDTIFLPQPGCYTLHLVDGFGDGMCCKYGNGFFRLFDINDPFYPLISYSNFGKEVYEEFVVQQVNQVSSVVAPSLLRLYPNPTTGVVVVDLPGADSSPSILQLYNLTGSEVMQATIPAGARLYESDLSALSAGLYLCRLSDANGRVVATGRLMLNN